MQIGIHGKEIKGTQIECIRTTFEALRRRDVRLWASNQFLQNTNLIDLSAYHLSAFERGDDLSHLDVLLSLGGDGTLLDSITYVGKDEVPVLGINIGRMGFLSTIGSDEVNKAIDCFFLGDYKTDRRAMLTLRSSVCHFGKLNFALNDFAILKKGTSAMININVSVDNELMNAYWADGLIIATPTGSTGYSMSCGGPLLYPNSKSFVITPISPHNLTVRPIVVPDSAEIMLHIEGRNKEALISLDSRFEFIDRQIELTIKKSKSQACLIQMPDKSYSKNLRQKLNWGLDVRN